MDIIMIVGKESELQTNAIDVARNSGLTSEVFQNGKKAIDYLGAVFKGKPNHPKPAFLFLDMQIEDMSGIEFLMQFSNFPTHKREETPVYIHTASKASYIASLPKVYECVKGIISPPLTVESLHEIIPAKKMKSTWYSWVKGFPLLRQKRRVEK